MKNNITISECLEWLYPLSLNIFLIVVYFSTQQDFLKWLFTILGVCYNILLLVFYLIAYFFLNREEKKVKATCKHGVVGANENPESCENCSLEIKKRIAEEQAAREAKRLQEIEEKRRKHNEWVKRIRLPEYLKTVNPREFELMVCELFRRLGYNANVTPYAGDGGIDGFLEKDGQKTVLQCKRVKGSVGEPVLRDLYGVMHASNANSAIVVTTGRVSNQARQWILNKPIRIIELQELHSLINENFKEGEVVPEAFILEKKEYGQCNRCGSPMEKVSGRYSDYLRCSDYPSCKYTKSIRKNNIIKA